MAVQIGTDRPLPGAVLAQGPALLDDPPGEAEQQGPGQLDGRGGGTRRTAHGDAVLLGGGVVDDAVAHTGGDDQPQPGQAGDQRAGESDAFAQGDHDVDVGEGRGERVLVGEVAVEGDDVDLVGQR